MEDLPYWSEKHHRTGKPYTCEDIKYLVERKERLDMYEMAFVWVHLESCSECEKLVEPVIDILIDEK
jgi:hypothetical protein